MSILGYYAGTLYLFVKSLNAHAKVISVMIFMLLYILLFIFHTDIAVGIIVGGIIVVLIVGTYLALYELFT